MPKERTFSELQKLAKEMNISGWYSMNKAQLTVATAQNDGETEKFVYDRGEGVPESEIKILKEERKQIPGKTIMWDKDKDLVMEIIDRNRWAFNNIDLTDPIAKIIHVFETSNKKKKIDCVCGEKFIIQQEYEEVRPNPQTGRMEKALVQGPAERRYCPNKECGRLYIWHGWDNLPKESEI